MCSQYTNINAHKSGWTGFCFVKKYDPFDPDSCNLPDLLLSALWLCTYHMSQTFFIMMLSEMWSVWQFSLWSSLSSVQCDGVHVVSRRAHNSTIVPHQIADNKPSTEFSSLSRHILKTYRNLEITCVSTFCQMWWLRSESVLLHS